MPARASPAASAIRSSLHSTATNKRDIGVDLGTAGGRSIVERLIVKADVFASQPGAFFSRVSYPCHVQTD
jgi:crotonobetainyl-CoA:carnitine CoA-transferase CaiB-like acyl-CoA transferase